MSRKFFLRPRTPNRRPGISSTCREIRLRFGGFLDRFPTGAHHAAAQQRLDEVEWESIDQQDPSALEEFARRYPQNPHVSYASQKRPESRDHGKLPKSENK